MKKLVTLMVLIALLVSVIPAGAAGGDTTAPGQAKKLGNSLYIVQMPDAPVVAYDGGVAGYPATKPKKGQKINPFDPKVEKYSGYLKGKHDAAMQSVGATKKAYSYVYSFNGFAAELDAAQAEAMKSTAGVLAISKDEARTLDTSSTPEFLGLTTAGAWTLGKEKKWGLAMASVCLVAWLGLTVFSPAALAAESFKARYSYHWFPTHHLAVYSEKFANLAKEETKGRLEVTTYPSGQLYSARDAIAAVSQGSVEMACCIALTLASAAPEFGVDTLMMLFDNYDQQRKAWAAEAGKAVIGRVEQKLGVKLLCRLPNGPACLFTSEKKVQDIEDSSQ